MFAVRFRRRPVATVASFVTTLLVVTLFAAPGGPAAAAGQQNYHRVFGPPDGQHGLQVELLGCSGAPGSTLPWPFRITGGSPDPWGPHAVGWDPPATEDALGVEAHIASPTTLDRFRMLINAPQGARGFAHLWYHPPQANRLWQGVARFEVAQSGWTLFEAGDTDFEWYRYTDGVFDGTVVTGQTIRGFTSAQGGNGGGAELAYYLGCDGSAFAIDGFEVGSSVNGWDAYDFDGYASRVSLRPTRSLSTCQTSPGRWPNKVSFRGRHSPGGVWRGEQFVGRRNGHWRVVARGRSADGFRYSAPVDENSWFDGVHPFSATTEFSDSRDWYVPAFPSIRIRAASRTVRTGKPLVFTGTIKPARRLSYTVLRSESERRRWSSFRSLGTFKTDSRGRFRFKVRSSNPGWARINIITKTERDLTSTINPRAVIYEVVKPKRKPQPKPPTPTPAPEPETSTPPPPDEGPPDAHLRQLKGFGRCRWVPAGRPPGASPYARTAPEAGALPSTTKAPVPEQPAPDQADERRGAPATGPGAAVQVVPSASGGTERTPPQRG